MKKPLKITLISLASIIAVVVVVAVVACYIVFTPQRLTPIVRDNVHRFVTCETHLDTVDLTFFSTFPRFVLHARNVQLINPMPNAQSDTLLAVDDLGVSVNVIKFLFDSDIEVDRLYIKNGYANIFSDTAGITNYDILALSGDTTDTDTTSSDLFNAINLSGISVDNVNATYRDLSAKIDAEVSDVRLTLDGQLQNADADINTNIQIAGITVALRDSTDIFARINDLDLNLDGELRDNHFTGAALLDLPQTTVALNSDTLLNRRALSLNAPAEVNLDIMHINLKEALLQLESHKLTINGIAQLEDDDDINLDITAATDKWVIDSLLTLVPESYKHLLEPVKQVHGQVSLSAHATGTYNATSMPVVNAEISLYKGVAEIVDIPYVLRNINGSVSAYLNLNDSITSATIKSLRAETGTMWADISGTATDLLGNPRINAEIGADINLPELAPMLPEDLKVDMKGRATATITAQTTLNDLTAFNLNRIKADGMLSYTNLDVLYNDSIHIVDSRGMIDLQLPSPYQNGQFHELLQATLKASNPDITMVGTMNASLAKPELTIGLGEFLDTTRFISARCQFDMQSLVGSFDTIDFNIDQPAGVAYVKPAAATPKDPDVGVTYHSNSIRASLGNSLDVNTKKVSIEASTAYDASQGNALLQWNPTLNVDMQQGVLDLSGITSSIRIPQIKFQFQPDRFDIDRSQIVIENSDFNLSGEISNIRNYLNERGFLEGDLDFVSNGTNIDELMAFVNELFPSSNEDSEEQKTGDSDDNVDFAKANAQPVPEEKMDPESEPDPFMVPRRINISLNTNIRKAIFNDTDIENLKGRLTVRDGIAVVEQMGFTCDAAEMQLTGIYRSDRRNHLFCGLDFHLLDIDIAQLIKMIPSIDTIVPMLKSFEGKAQFHIAAETYLFADYTPKMSTLRAAAALEGKDLVLMDSELFSTISKYMMFNKKTKNLVDSLSVEMTVFRNEVDIYPFLISMDKWQAVLAGRHNLDMSFDYHISLTDCPLPVRLGLDVKGTFDDMKFDLVPCKYKALYKPEKQKPTDKQTLALKKLISDSLKRNVK